MQNNTFSKLSVPIKSKGRFYFENYGINVACLRIGSVINDNNPVVKNSNRFFSTWCSHDDISGLIEACIDSKNNSSAILLAKDNGIIAGVELAKYIFNEVDSKIIVENDFIDGSIVKKGDIIMTINGNTQSILKAERLVLNCMQQMSAIATKTNNICRKISTTTTKILDTRKTIPLNRKIQKWAVNIGGGKNHRFALDDMIMISCGMILGVNQSHL